MTHEAMILESMERMKILNLSNQMIQEFYKEGMVTNFFFEDKKIQITGNFQAFVSYFEKYYHSKIYYVIAVPHIFFGRKYRNIRLYYCFYVSNDKRWWKKEKIELKKDRQDVCVYEEKKGIFTFETIKFQIEKGRLNDIF
ncbi:hypothetical protein ACPE2W_000322 [Enterococcus hirae]